MKSPSLSEGCICGLVTPENPVARETIFAKEVLSHASGLLVSGGIGSISVTGESLKCKVGWPDHNNRFSRENFLMQVKQEISQFEHFSQYFIFFSSKCKSM